MARSPAGPWSSPRAEDATTPAAMDRSRGRASYPFAGPKRRLLDLGLFEVDVLARHRVVLLEHELLLGGLAVLALHVEVARPRGRLELHELTVALGHGVSRRSRSLPT